MSSELSPRRKLLQAALFPLWKLSLKPRGPAPASPGVRLARAGLFSAVELLLSSERVQGFTVLATGQRGLSGNDPNRKRRNQGQRETEWLTNSPWRLLSAFTLWITTCQRAWCSKQNFWEAGRADILLQTKTRRLRDSSHLPRAAQTRTAVVRTWMQRGHLHHQTPAGHHADARKPGEMSTLVLEEGLYHFQGCARQCSRLDKWQPACQ